MKFYKNVWQFGFFRRYLKEQIFDNEQTIKVELDKEAEESFSKIEKEIFDSGQKNFEQLDTHLIYIAAGAIYVVSELFQSASNTEYLRIDLLSISFAFFVVCITAIIASFIFQGISLMRNQMVTQGLKFFLKEKIPALAAVTAREKAYDDLIDFVFEEKPFIKNENLKKSYVSARKVWHSVWMHSFLADAFAFLTRISNLLAYISFFVGIISLLLFALPNLSTMNNPNQNLPNKIEKSYDASSLHANNIAEQVSGSGNVFQSSAKPKDASVNSSEQPK